MPKPVRDPSAAYPVSVTLAPDVREGMRQLAERHKRSLNAELQVAAEEYLERHDSALPPPYVPTREEWLALARRHVELLAWVEQTMDTTAAEYYGDLGAELAQTERLIARAEQEPKS